MSYGTVYGVGFVRPEEVRFALVSRWPTSAHSADYLATAPVLSSWWMLTAL